MEQILCTLFFFTFEFDIILNSPIYYHYGTGSQNLSKNKCFQNNSIGSINVYLSGHKFDEDESRGIELIDGHCTGVPGTYTQQR